MKGEKPIILWTCDVPGWAYHGRIMRISKVLTEYEHRIWYFGNPLPLKEKQRHLQEADIIVCQGIKSLRIVQMKRLDFTGDTEYQKVLNERFKNIVTRLDSVRIDINGEYYDIWTGEKMP